VQPCEEASVSLLGARLEFSHRQSLENSTRRARQAHDVPRCPSGTPTPPRGHNNYFIFISLRSLHRFHAASPTAALHTFATRPCNLLVAATPQMSMLTVRFRAKRRRRAHRGERNLGQQRDPGAAGIRSRTADFTLAFAT